VQTENRSIRVLIADDHRLMREGTGALLAEDPRIDVVGLARDGREVIDLAEALRPDVVLLDLNMPGLGGMEACALLRRRAPDSHVLMLTVSEHQNDLYAALRVGAAGYLLKDMPPADLIQAVLEAGHGEPQLAPAMAARMISDLAPSSAAGQERSRATTLSERELEVLSLLAEGVTNRELAERLFISEATVKTHVRHVLEKLHLRNRAEAAAFATRQYI